MADLIADALAQAFRNEIAHVFGTSSRDIQHRGGHRATAATIVQTIENLQKLYNEVIDLLEKKDDEPD